MAFYHLLTLGVRRSRPSTPSKALTKGPFADLSYEMWREGLARLDITYKEYPEARVLEAVRRSAAHAGSRFWLILGEPGAGKSTLLKAWFGRWAGALTELHLGMPVPVLVPLRELNPGDLDGDGTTVASRLWNYGVPSRALLDRPLEQVYSPGRGPVFQPVWFLDGLDEMIFEKVLGPDHPHVGTSLNNLAGLHREQGKDDLAEPLYKRSLAILEKTLPLDHPHRMWALENYGRLLDQLGRHAEAAELRAQTPAIR